MSKITLPDCIAEKINFNAVRSQEDLNTAISQAYDACAKEHPADCGCGKGEKKKREPSEYNIFIKDCFHEKPNTTLKDCAADWTDRRRNNPSPR
jgi:hypothetical protein